MTPEEAQKIVDWKKAGKKVNPKHLAEAKKVLEEAKKKAEADKKDQGAKNADVGPGPKPAERAEEEDESDGKAYGDFVGGWHEVLDVSRRETFAVVSPCKGDFVIQCAA